MKPDSFIRIHEKEEDNGVSEHTSFLEVDRSSDFQSELRFGGGEGSRTPVLVAVHASIYMCSR